MVYHLVQKLILVLGLQCKNKYALAYYHDFDSVEVDRVSWPLQAEYPGLTVDNLNEYISLFSHCLVNIQNFQGIELPGITFPIYITRSDVLYLNNCTISDDRSGSFYRFLFGKLPENPENNCTVATVPVIKTSDKSSTSRWYCTAQFDLFFPEPKEAPHFFHHIRDKAGEWRGLFDISINYIRWFERRGIKFN